jgi:hypothetical protein
MLKPVPPSKRRIAAAASTERIIALLWSEVLRSDAQPHARDNFFSSGGDVIAAARLELRIEDELPVALRPGTVRDAPTLRELSSSVDQQIKAARAAYIRFMSQGPPPKEFETLLKSGMPGSPGLLGDPEFIARARASGNSHSAKRTRRENKGREPPSVDSDPQPPSNPPPGKGDRRAR